MKYDVFISYRRSGGKEKARPLKSELERRGYKVFLDFDDLKDSVFDKRIMDAIDEAPIFLIILSEHSLDRCKNEDDWVRKEIEYAYMKNKHFVPVNPDKEFKDFPEDIPNAIKQCLGQHQFSSIDFEQLFQLSIDKMVEDRIHPIISSLRESSKKQTGALVRIETDLDCRVLRFKEELVVAKSNEITEIRLPKGTHKLTFEGLESKEDSCTIIKDIKDLDFEDYVEVKLLDKYNARKEREKVLEEEERKGKDRENKNEQKEKNRKKKNLMLEGIKFEINHKIRQNKKWIFISFAIVFLGVTAFCVVNLVNNIDNNKFKSEYSDYIRLVEEGDSLAKLMKYDDTLNVYKVAKEEVKATNVINGHEYVDLGLPSGLKWASCNIGASAPDAFGNYYAWGELNVKAEYSPNTSTTMSKQMKDISSNPQYDVANATWGESWRMPTEKELYELINGCTWTWTTQNGVEGYKVTGPNGNSIFLPVAGYRYWSSLRNVRSYGYYWASSPYQNDYAYCLYFSVKGHGVYSSNRYRGQSVRPVTE